MLILRSQDKSLFHSDLRRIREFHWTPRDGLSGPLFAIKPYARLRAYPYDPNFDATQMNTDTLFIGRSVWNTKWLLVMPGPRC